MWKYLLVGLFVLYFPRFAYSDLSQEKTRESDKMNQIFEEYFEEFIKLNPVYATLVGDRRYDDRLANDISEEHRNRQRELYTGYLDKISGINRELLQGQDRLSYDIFRRNMLLNLEGLQFDDHLIPVDQMSCTPLFFVQLGSGSSLHPFKTVRDYENFLKRMEDFKVWVNTAISNMRKGIQKGVVQPKIVIERVIPQLKVQLVDDATKSTFYQPVNNFPEDFSDDDKLRLTRAYSEAIETGIIPAYRKLVFFLEDEYLPRTRESIAMSELPNGPEWYAFNVKWYTTTNLTSDEIFEIGMKEVKRIRNEMEVIKAEAGFEGNLKEFLKFLSDDPQFYFNSEEDLLNGYEIIRNRIDPELPKYFELLPGTDYEIRPVEEFRAKSAPGGSYMPASPDGSRPGVFYVNTYNLKANPTYKMHSIMLHEAAPGHHFQISLQYEQKELPKFRRFGLNSAYIEGWAMYSEDLGKELNIYKDQYQYFGKLSNEIWRAVRLVVDTGMHTKGWTKEEALNFMYENIDIAESSAVAEVERYIAWPGQALAYQIGHLKMLELRTMAEKKLGTKFDIKTFHNEILRDGALPLDVLETKINEWIEKQ